jgi:Flp pilus assembly protein TadB
MRTRQFWAWHGSGYKQGMTKLPLQNLVYLLISAICAVALAYVLTHSSPNSLVAVLCAFVTVLCVQIAFMQKELAKLKDQMPGTKSQ